MTRSERTATRLIALLFVFAALLTLAPVWVPLVLAAWFADLLQPRVAKLQHVFRGRRRGAAAVVVILALLVLLPLTGMVIGVVAGVGDLLAQLRSASSGGGSIAQALLGGTPTPSPSWRDWASLLSRYGASAWSALTAVAQFSTSFVIGVVVFGLGLYTLALRGPRLLAWMVRVAPMPREVFLRFASAFFETGRGLLIGNGVTALAQGAAATLVYVAIGLPRALLLGPLTMLAAFVPVFGTGLVWVPLAIGLAVTGEYARAITITVLGAGVLSIMDNFLRPVLTRYGKLRMPTYLVLVAMLGGVGAFGGAGILLGPLLVRLAIEALDVAHERHLFRA